MIEVFKITSGISGSATEDYFTVTADIHQHVTRGNQAGNLYTPKCRLEQTKGWFTNRVIANWNELPAEIRSSTSVNSFKNNYDNWKRERP